MNLAEKILGMKEKRANLTLEIRGIMDAHEEKEMAQEKKDELRKLETDFDKLNESIGIQERQLERERLNGEVQSKTEERKETNKQEEIRSAFIKCLREGTKDATLAEYRALANDNPTQAGYLVAPEQFVNTLIQDLKNIVFMRQISRMLPAMKGSHSVGFPVLTNRVSTFAWGTELSTPTADTSLKFGKRLFKLNPATGEIVVSKTLLEHASSVDQIVREELAYDAAINLEQAYMTGDGVGKPLGVFTAHADGISTNRDVATGNTSTEIKFDGLKEAKYSLEEQYLRSLNLNWLFHRDAVKKLAKLKDGDGQYIWQQNVSAGEPDRLLSIPVRMSEYAPNTFTANLYAGLLGDFNFYWIQDGMDMQIQVLLELYARQNQIDYIYRLETDGAPVREKAFVRIKLGA